MPAHQRRPSVWGSTAFPRPGLALRRRPRLGWLLTAVAAIGAAVAVGSIVASAEQARTAWGRSVTVVVATHDLAPGAELDAGDVALVVRPTAAVPHGALHEPPDGRLLHHAVFDGEVLLAAHLAPAGQHGLAARVAHGHRAVALPVSPGLVPPLESGQRVDVVAVTADGDAEVVAERAEVLHVSDDEVTVAVIERDVPRIVAALAAGAVTVTIVGDD